MNKAFVKEDAHEEEEDHPSAPTLPHGTKNYMTRRGYALLKAELEQLVKAERPALVKVVSWAAKNGDRSENGDYIYGKKRLREIDRRIRFLTKRLESAVIVVHHIFRRRSLLVFIVSLYRVFEIVNVSLTRLSYRDPHYFLLIDFLVCRDLLTGRVRPGVVGGKVAQVLFDAM